MNNYVIEGVEKLKKTAEDGVTGTGLWRLTGSESSYWWLAGGTLHPVTAEGGVSHADKARHPRIALSLCLSVLKSSCLWPTAARSTLYGSKSSFSSGWVPLGILSLLSLPCWRSVSWKCSRLSGWWCLMLCCFSRIMHHHANTERHAGHQGAGPARHPDWHPFPALQNYRSWFLSMVLCNKFITYLTLQRSPSFYNFLQKPQKILSVLKYCIFKTMITKIKY